MGEFGGLLRRCRLDAHRTLKSVADELGVSPVYVSEVELGKRPPFNSSRIEQVANFCNADAKPLMEQACRERGFLEVDMARATRAQVEVVSGLARGGLSDDQWEQINQIVNNQNSHGD
jgi:transcriptional regulator with XRE-family HTH domain